MVVELARIAPAFLSLTLLGCKLSVPERIGQLSRLTPQGLCKLMGGPD